MTKNGMLTANGLSFTSLDVVEASGDRQAWPFESPPATWLSRRRSHLAGFSDRCRFGVMASRTFRDRRINLKASKFRLQLCTLLDGYFVWAQSPRSGERRGSNSRDSEFEKMPKFRPFPISPFLPHFSETDAMLPLVAAALRLVPTQSHLYIQHCMYKFLSVWKRERCLDRYATGGRFHVLADQLGSVMLQQPVAKLALSRDSITGRESGTLAYTLVHVEPTMETLKVGMREFRDNLATYLLESETPVAITRHGDTVGYFIPARRRRSVSVRATALFSPGGDRVELHA